MSSINNSIINTNNKGNSIISVNFSNYYNKVSISGGDENWGFLCCTAGDQTGREWEIKIWY